MASWEDTYRRYSDRADFVTIYTREAHPIDGWYLGSAHPLRAHQTLTDRMRAAAVCLVFSCVLNVTFLSVLINACMRVWCVCQAFASTHKLSVPLYVEPITNIVSDVFVGWPEKLIIYENGTATFVSGEVCGCVFCCCIDAGDRFEIKRRCVWRSLSQCLGTGKVRYSRRGSISRSKIRRFFCFCCGCCGRCDSDRVCYRRFENVQSLNTARRLLRSSAVVAVISVVSVI